MTSHFSRALALAATPEALSLDDIIALLAANPDESAALFALANNVRQQAVGDRVNLRGIIEFSNYCKEHCLYCGLRADNTKAHRYRLSKNEIIAAAEEAVRCGYKTLVLQSGEDPYYTPEDIADITRQVKKLGIAITLSCGEQPEDVYRLWREAGADRYLIKQECADPAIYSQIRPGKSLADRIAHQKTLARLGYQVGSGCMVGLPGQTLATLAADLLLMRDNDIEMSGIGPFIPHPDTPLAGATAGDPELVFKVVAVARILMPYCMLPATTSLATLHPQGRERVLAAGADVIMPNVSPQAYRAYYEIYPNKISSQSPICEHRQQMEDLIRSVGRTVADDLGHSPKPTLLQGKEMA